MSLRERLREFFTTPELAPRRCAVHCGCGAFTFPSEEVADEWIKHHTCVAPREEGT